MKIEESKNIIYPLDIYQVVDKSLLNEHDRQILAKLYMPLIGSTAISLYLKLQSEASSCISAEQTHKHLMTSMGLNLDNIKEARLKLEGIGLLKTYLYYAEPSSLVYELYSPLSAQEFFTHPIFNVVLFNNVGKEEYNRLLESFKLPSVSLREYEEVTMPFDKVFKSRNYTYIETSGENIVSKNKLMLSFELDFDFDLIIATLKSSLNQKCLNKSMKELIIELAFLYDIDPLTMSDLIRASINEKGNIVKEDLRKNTRKYYQFNNNNRLPSILFKSQPEYLKQSKEPTTQEAKIIQLFENTTPYDFLTARNRGVRPTEKEMEILEYLLVDMKFKPAVVNVLLDYVLKVSNKKLNKNFIEAIASQWNRNNIETALEAMEIAKKEHKKITESKKKTKEPVKKKTENLPSWFNKEIKSEDPSSDEEYNDLMNTIKEYRE